MRVGCDTLANQERCNIVEFLVLGTLIWMLKSGNLIDVVTYQRANRTFDSQSHMHFLKLVFLAGRHRGCCSGGGILSLGNHYLLLLHVSDHRLFPPACMRLVAYMLRVSDHCRM